MRQPERNRPEIAAGLIWVGIGLGATLIASAYAFGTIVRMGPGFVPIMLGILLAVLGLVVAWQGRRLPKVSLDLRFRAIACILGGIIVWVAMIDHLGFVPSTLALIGISALAERGIKPMETAALAAGMTIVGYLIFIYGIGIPIAAFGN